MFKYDEKRNILTIQKIEHPKLETNLLSDLQSSYDKYCTVTALKDVKYFFEEVLSDNKFKYTVYPRIGRRVTPKGRNFTVAQYSYYPVLVSVEETVVATGQTTTFPGEYEIFRIPYMDEFGKLYTSKGLKVCLGLLKPSEDAAYDADSKIYNIAMPNGNLRIAASMNKRGYNISALGTKNSKISLLRIIKGMLYNVSHDMTDDKETELFDVSQVVPTKIFVNNIARNIMKGTELTELRNEANDEAVKNFIRKLSKDNTLLHDMYNIGDARDALNNLYDLRSAIGCISSRDIKDQEGNLICKLNEKITEDVVRAVHKAGDHIIYVWNEINPAGYYIVDPIHLTYIPAGVRNCDYLRKKLPQYKHYETIPERIEGDPYIIEIWDGEKLTPDLVELFKSLGITYLECYVGDNNSTASAGNTVTLSLEREIVGNHFARLGELRKPNDHESYNDWVYTFNNPTFQIAKHDEIRDPLHYLTVHDFEAIFCDICRILETGEATSLLNRDEAFLKRISMIDETFSKYFRRYVDKFYRSSTINQKYIKALRDAQPKSKTFTDNWIKEMNAAKVLATIDSTNMMAEITQVAHANIELTDPPDPVRRLAIPYYGRICPFETPAGKKLGLVNTKAIGCRIGSKGLPEVPYYKIINKGGRPAINYKKIHWLTVKEEIGNIFVDLFSLTVDRDGNIADGYALARIPNTDNSGEPFIISRIATSELVTQQTLDGRSNASYVNVYPEQILSPSACMIPFASSDDATRISYGLSQMKQAIYLADPQVPSVITSMYEDIFTYSDYKGMTSPCDGKVISNNNDTVVIEDSVTGDHVTVSPATSHTLITDEVTTADEIANNKDDTMLYANPVVKVGDEVKKGDIVIDVGVYPKQFLTRSPVDGVVETITTTSITIRVQDGNPNWNKLVIDPNNVPIMIPYQGIRIIGNTIMLSTLKIAVGDKVNKGDILVETNMSKNGYYTPSRDALIAYIPIGYNHEDGILVSEKAADDYTSIICHTIKTSASAKYVKTRNIQPVRDMTYHKSGDVVSYVASNMKDMQNVKHYHNVYATDKMHGMTLDAMSVYDETAASKRHYETYLLGLNKLSEGDKMSGRHGDKGVVSRVEKNSMMPQFMNGEIPDIVLNPHGVPSRMNLGKIDDVHLGQVAHMTLTRINSDSFNGATPEEITALVHFSYDFMTWLRDGRVSDEASLIALTNSIEEYRAVQFDPAWLAHVWKSRHAMEKWINAFNRDGTAQMYDPKTDTMYRTPVTFGWAYFFKLMQEAEEKICYRSGPMGESYSRTHSQPLKQENVSAKGQKFGEMELVALAAYGASGIIDEVLNEKSDNRGKSFNVHAAQMLYDERVPEEYCQSRASENLIAYLMGVGVNIHCNKDVHNMDEIMSNDKYTYDLKHVVTNHCAPDKNVSTNLKGATMSGELLDIIKAML